MLEFEAPDIDAVQPGYQFADVLQIIVYIVFVVEKSRSKLQHGFVHGDRDGVVRFVGQRIQIDR